MLQLNIPAEQIPKLQELSQHYPHQLVRRKAMALLLKKQNIPHYQIAEVLDISNNTLLNYFQQYQDGGITQIEQLNFYQPTSKLEPFTATIKEHFDKNPATSIASARKQIQTLTGNILSITQTRIFLKKLGLNRYKVNAIPAKADTDKQARFHDEHLMPRLEEAQQFKRSVYFVDASHFVFAAFLGYLWSFTRLFVKSPSGRQRFNVLGAINAITHKLITVTNTSYINAQSICELLHKIADQHVGEVTLILDNARYQKCIIVTSLAKKLNIELLYLPTYSPNLNLIERLWKFVKKDCLYSKYYADFDMFKQSITNCLEDLPNREAELKTLLNLKFQDFAKQEVKLAA